MTTDKDVADDFEKWRADAIKQGYEVTESVWNYEGREIPMISVWPARGTKEHLRMLKEFADFLWDLRHLAASRKSNQEIPESKSLRSRPRSGKKKSDRSS